jgi:fructosamine-3-kinase
MDLAMLQLFGAPSVRFFAAYDAVYPRAPGHAGRLPLYQLYPLLVHLCLFGRAYRAQLADSLARALRAA